MEVNSPPTFVYLSGDWDVHWGYDLDFDPWPNAADVAEAFSSAKAQAEAQQAQAEAEFGQAEALEREKTPELARGGPWLGHPLRIFGGWDVV